MEIRRIWLSLFVLAIVLSGRPTQSVGPAGVVTFLLTVSPGEVAAATGLALGALETMSRAPGVRAAAVAKADHVWDSDPEMTQEQFGSPDMPLKGGGVFSTEISATADAISPSGNRLTVTAASRRDAFVYNGNVQFSNPVLNDPSSGGLFGVGLAKDGFLFGTIKVHPVKRKGRSVFYPASIRVPVSFELSQLDLFYHPSGFGTQASITVEARLQDGEEEVWSSDIISVTVALRGPEYQDILIKSSVRDALSIDEFGKIESDGEFSSIALNTPVIRDISIDVPFERGGALYLDSTVRLGAVDAR